MRESTLVLNSLASDAIDKDVRNRVKAGFGINISLATFMQGASIKTLAAYPAEQLQEKDRTKPVDGSVSRDLLEVDARVVA